MFQESPNSIATRCYRRRLCTYHIKMHTIGRIARILSGAVSRPWTLSSDDEGFDAEIENEGARVAAARLAAAGGV